MVQSRRTGMYMYGIDKAQECFGSHSLHTNLNSAHPCCSRIMESASEDGKGDTRYPPPPPGQAPNVTERHRLGLKSSAQNFVMRSASKLASWGRQLRWHLLPILSHSSAYCMIKNIKGSFIVITLGEKCLRRFIASSPREEGPQEPRSIEKIPEIFLQEVQSN